MAWGKNGTPKTLDATATSVGITDLNSKKFNEFFIHSLPSGSSAPRLLTLNGQAGSAYSYEIVDSNGADSPVTGSSSMIMDQGGSWGDDSFHFGFIASVTGQEKIIMFWSIGDNGATAASEPRFRKYYGICDNTVALTSINFTTSGGSGSASGTNFSVLGSDTTPAAAVAIKVQDGSIFYETDTNKEYVLYNNTWTEV